MRTMTSALRTFLLSEASRQLAIADLYTFYDPSGSPIAYVTDWETNLKVSGITYHACGSKQNQDGQLVPLIHRTQAKSGIGFTTDGIDITLGTTPVATLFGIPLLQAFYQGLMDGAGVTIQRLVMATPGVVDVTFGTIIDMIGEVGDISSMGRTGLKVAVVNKAFNLLDTLLPRALFSPGCRHSLFDTGCTLSASSFRLSGIVQSGSDFINIKHNLGTSYDGIGPPASAPSCSASGAPAGANLLARTLYVTATYLSANGETVASPQRAITLANNQIVVVTSPASATGALAWNCYIGVSPGAGNLQNGTPISIGTSFTEPYTGEIAGLPAPVTSASSYFAQGVITFTSGTSNGLSRTIATGAGGVVVLVARVPVTPLAGDTFTIVPGCDKSSTTCSNKFSNLIHFGGFPNIPNPETVL